jgi:alkylation response protein AidB-like acyl-CoA dehydrogenase
MTFDLTSDQTARVAEVRRLAADILAPAAADIDQSGRFPEAVIRALGTAAIWSQTPFEAVLAIADPSPARHAPSVSSSAR